jgi:ABC-2 type transport system permease protein
MSSAFIFVVASIFIPFNTFGYDEKTETNILLNSLPYTRKEIIASRYLGAIVYMIFSIAVTSLALWVFNKPFTMTDIAIGIGLFLLFVALSFPVFYIFKPGYLIHVVLISFILLAGIGPHLVQFLIEHVTAFNHFLVNTPASTLYTAAAVGIIVIYGISWVLLR